MKQLKINIPESDRERVVVIGGGFAGLNFARRLARGNYQVVLIDRNNYHQFQPLFYQVAMSGLEPSSIIFPLRRLFHRMRNVYIRVTEVTAIEPEKKRFITPLGHCNYDHLVIATGATTNFFGNRHIEEHAMPMKSVGEALFLRNSILTDYEKALSTMDYDSRQGLIDIVIVGGGPTGVELAGALAEMRKYVLPKDYPELNVEEEIDIVLVQSGGTLLKGMSERASAKSLKYLQKMGVEVLLNTKVVDFDGSCATTDQGRKIRCRKLIWAAGIRGDTPMGLPESVQVRGNRIRVDRYNRVEGMDCIYAIGDIAYMEEPNFPKGHPQVAQTAIQQGKHLARNFLKATGAQWVPFSYKDKGSMATIGRAKAVADLPKTHFSGITAWIIWLIVHLFSLLGTRNRLFVFLNWVWGYVNYDQSLRLIIRPHIRPSPRALELRETGKPTDGG